MMTQLDREHTQLGQRAVPSLSASNLGAAHTLRRIERVPDPEASQAFLFNARVGRLGSLGTNGPYITPLCFVFTPPDTIYFHSASSGHKLDNLDEDPRVCFEVDETLTIIESDRACSCSIKYISVVVFGVARRVAEAKEKTRILELIMNKYTDGAYPIISQEIDSNTAIVAVDIGHMSGKTNLSRNELLDRLQGL